MITMLLSIGLILFVIGVVLICFEKQKLGTMLTLINPIGLVVFVYLSVKKGVAKSLKIYLFTLGYTLLDN